MELAKWVFGEEKDWRLKSPWVNIRFGLENNILGQVDIERKI